MTYSLLHRGALPVARAAHVFAGWRRSRHFGDRRQIGGRVMARTVRKCKVKEVPLSEIKDDLSRYLREAETQGIVITRHGKPAGI
jgi:hypothetical protein